MGEYLRLARFYLLLLAIVTVGRWLLGTAFQVPYEKGTDKLSIVTMTLFASLFYGAFCRRWRGFGIARVLALTALLGLFAQLVIFLATLASYALGVESYFTHPTALQAEAPLPMTRALLLRAGGLIAGPVTNVFAGAIGWAMGALLPEPRP